MLEMDTMTELMDPDMAIDAARLHLDGISESALVLYRLLDAAHNETAHIAIADRLAKHAEDDARDNIPLASRSDNRHSPGGGRRNRPSPRR